MLALMLHNSIKKCWPYLSFPVLTRRREELPQALPTFAMQESHLLLPVSPESDHTTRLESKTAESGTGMERDGFSISGGPCQCQKAPAENSRGFLYFLGIYLLYFFLFSQSCISCIFLRRSRCKVLQTSGVFFFIPYFSRYSAGVRPCKAR